MAVKPGFSKLLSSCCSYLSVQGYRLEQPHCVACLYLVQLHAGLQRVLFEENTMHAKAAEVMPQGICPCINRPAGHMGKSLGDSISSGSHWSTTYLQEENRTCITSPRHLGVLQSRYLFLLPEQMGAGADGLALVGFLEQLCAVARGLVHKHVAVLRSEDATSVQRAHDALQCCDLSFAVWYCFLVQYEGLQAQAGMPFAVVACL